MNTQTTTITLQANVINQLKDLSDSSLQVCHNNYCNELGYEDNIYDNDELEDIHYNNIVYDEPDFMMVEWW